MRSQYLQLIALLPTCYGATIIGPLIDSVFPDPTIIEVNSTFYAFSSRNTEKNTTINVPIASSSHFYSGWTLHEGADALPDAGSWTADVPEVLTPDVSQLEDNTFILYYIAKPAKNPNEHCIGVATSPSILGPYTPQSTPFLCPSYSYDTSTHGYGTADPNLLTINNTNYLVFKNASGHDPTHTSNLVLLELSATGLSPATPYTNPAPWIDLINSTAADDRDVEGSCLVLSPNPGPNNEGRFVLFFTTGTFNTTTLQIQYATSRDIDGPYVRRGTLLETGVYNGRNLSAFVGLDALANNASRVTLEAWLADVHVRMIFAAEVQYSGDNVTVL